MFKGGRNSLSKILNKVYIDKDNMLEITVKLGSTHHLADKK